MQSKSFASDNYSGVHPQIIEALSRANFGHEGAYGADSFTAALSELIKDLFGSNAEVYPVFTGTGANVVGLQSMQSRWGAVICADSAHINTDENGAPERVGGMKLLPVATADGKLTPELVATEAWGWGDEHRAQPAVVSITQSTEFGTLYQPDEISQLAETSHSNGMLLHLDGARIANAAAALQLPLRALTTETGVDLFSLGGTKNGLMFGELIVSLNPAATPGLNYLRKLNMQQSSKTRYISAQFIELLSTELWRENALAANSSASLLRQILEDAITNNQAPGLSFTQKTEVNSVFARLPIGVADRIRTSFGFYDWDQAGQVRWMTSFDTTAEDVAAFAEAIKTELQSAAE